MKKTSEDVYTFGGVHVPCTRMPGESYRRRLGSLLCSRDVFPSLINSLCWFKRTAFLLSFLVTRDNDLNSNSTVI